MKRSRHSHNYNSLFLKFSIATLSTPATILPEELS
jgi:hypothetical protein